MGRSVEDTKDCRRVELAGIDDLGRGSGARLCRLKDEIANDFEDNQVIFRFLLQQARAFILSQEELRRANPEDPRIAELEARLGFINELREDQLDLKGEKMFGAIENLPQKEREDKDADRIRRLDNVRAFFRTTLEDLRRELRRGGDADRAFRNGLRSVRDLLIRLERFPQ